MKRRTLVAGAVGSVLAGGAVFFDDVVEFARSDARDAVSLDVDPDVLTSDAPKATATVRNDALVPVRTNLANWRVLRDGERVVPEGWVQPLHSLAPGESHSYAVRLGGEPTEMATSDSTVWLGDVGPGEYVFRLDVGVGDESRTVEAGFRVESSVES
ncbi:hypothetical protein [Halorubellus sp. PRR65]|uniref:hypothetical protein n=1 Tax=Halorubellus sp. PRR65 TaxID=3098148 RepID=UPI002B262F03|nr:hypothetical protein [Halorubellus sp. PRR65]